jgi:hypothetical protein
MTNRAIASQFSTSPWRELYKAALFETDRNKIPSRIGEAEKAIIERARELFGSATDTIEEDQALDDALYALRALQHCVGSNDAPAAAA